MTKRVTPIPQEDKADLFDFAWKMTDQWGKYDLRFFREPYREYAFHPTRKWRFDFAWTECKVAVEIDGNAWNVKGGGRHAQDSDRDKLNTAAALGWRVLRFSPQQLTDHPTECVELVVQALAYKP